MRRLLLVLSVAALMAAMMVASAMPAFAAANPERAAQQAQITSNFEPGALGPAAKRACNPNVGDDDRGCGDEVSARGNYGDTQRS